MGAGGLAIATPFGTLYSTNITPDKQYGIGNYTRADFHRVMRDGIAPGRAQSLSGHALCLQSYNDARRH